MRYWVYASRDKPKAPEQSAFALKSIGLLTRLASASRLVSVDAKSPIRSPTLDCDRYCRLPVSGWILRSDALSFGATRRSVERFS
jgi:hypothetical protein